MAEEVLTARVSIDKSKSEGIDERRYSLPIFSSDLGKGVPNYLRVSAGSCHDFCKYGKETTALKQNPPWIKKTVVAPNAVLGKSLPMAKTAKATMSEASFKQSASSGKEIKHSGEFPTSSKSKLLKKKSSAGKTAATSGSSKSEKLKRDMPTPVGSWNGGRSNLDLQVVGKGNGNKRDAKFVNRRNEGRKHDLVTESVKALSTLTPRKPPSSPSPWKLATKAKTPSSSTPLPLIETTKVIPQSSLTQLKAANSLPSSAAKKLTTATVKTSPPINPLRNVKTSISKDQVVKKVEASKVRVTEAVTTRRCSMSYKSKTATNLTRKELQLEKLVEAETKEFYEEKKEKLSHAAEFGKQEVMESYDEVPEKTLYVVKLETGNKTQPPACAEEEIPDMQSFASLSQPPLPRSPTHVTASNANSQHEVSIYDLTDTALPCAEETPEMQSYSPPISHKYPSRITASNTSSHYEEVSQDDTYTESEEGCFSSEDDHFVEGENLKSADNTTLQESSTISLNGRSHNPVKLKFRRGRVVDIKQETDGPKRLKFRREQVLEENNAEDVVHKSSFTFKKTEVTQNNASMDNSSGIVVLRHQDMQDKKDAPGLFNNVIEETASKLVETRKSKVKALVGAFETVISLQDGKPASK